MGNLKVNSLEPKKLYDYKVEIDKGGLCVSADSVSTDSDGMLYFSVDGEVVAQFKNWILWARFDKQAPSDQAPAPEQQAAAEQP